MSSMSTSMKFLLPTQSPMSTNSIYAKYFNIRAIRIQRKHREVDYYYNHYYYHRRLRHRRHLRRRLFSLIAAPCGHLLHTEDCDFRSIFINVLLIFQHHILSIIWTDIVDDTLGNVSLSLLQSFPPPSFSTFPQISRLHFQTARYLQYSSNRLEVLCCPVQYFSVDHE